MLLDNLVTAPVPAAGKNLNRNRQNALNAVGDRSFKEVFTTLTKTIEKSRNGGTARETSDTPALPDKNDRPAEFADATARHRPADDENAVADFSADAPDNPPAETEVPEEDENASAEDIPLLPVLAPLQLEIIERITVLSADNGLDPQLLAGLDENALGELADWVLAGAGGLFPENTAAAEPLPPSTEIPEFGLAQSSTALNQLDSLMRRVETAPVRETALLGDLINLENMSALDVDRLAQAVLQAVNGAENSRPAAGDLRELLMNTPADALRSALENALEQVENPVSEKLPEMPEVVLKSLAVEIVNVNNAALDAADKHLALLNGLDNNAQLRSELLQQVSGSDAETLVSAFNGEKLNENLENSQIFAELSKNGTEVVIDKNAANTAAAQTAISSARRETPENALPENPAKGKAKAENAKNPATAEISAADETAPEKPLTIEMVENPEVNSDETATSEKPLPKTETHNAHAAKAENDAENPENSEEADNSASEFRPAESTTQTFSPHRDNPLNFDYGAAKEAENSRQAVLQDNINRLAELVEQAAKNSATTLKSLTLALNPHELGSVRVELEMTQSGGVNATIKVENDSARSLMMSGIDQLKKSLELQGVNLEQFNIEMDGKDAGDQRQNPQQQAAGGEWFDAQSDERERRAREAANRIDTPRARPAEEIEEETADETPRMRHIDGNSFELIA